MNKRWPVVLVCTSLIVITDASYAHAGARARSSADTSREDAARQIAAHEVPTCQGNGVVGAAQELRLR
jgi:hypothetical protein